MKAALILPTLITLVAATAGQANAQTLRPGLWQGFIATPGKTPHVDPMAEYIAQVKKDMAKMSPEERKEAQALLDEAASNGIEHTADGILAKACITKQQVANSHLLFGRDQQPGCTEKRSPFLAGKTTMTFECTRPQKSSGSLIIQFKGDTAYSMTGTASYGPGKAVAVSGWGKWLGNDCGKIKPEPDTRD